MFSRRVKSASLVKEDDEMVVRLVRLALPLVKVNLKIGHNFLLIDHTQLMKALK